MDSADLARGEVRAVHKPPGNVPVEPSDFCFEDVGVELGLAHGLMSLTKNQRKEVCQRKEKWPTVHLSTPCYVSGGSAYGSPVTYRRDPLHVPQAQLFCSGIRHEAVPSLATYKERTGPPHLCSTSPRTADAAGPNRARGSGTNGITAFAEHRRGTPGLPLLTNHYPYQRLSRIESLGSSLARTAAVTLRKAPGLS